MEHRLSFFNDTSAYNGSIIEMLKFALLLECECAVACIAILSHAPDCNQNKEHAKPYLLKGGPRC